MCYRIEREIMVMCFRQRFMIKQEVYNYFVFVKCSCVPIVHVSSNVVHLALFS